MGLFRAGHDFANFLVAAEDGAEGNEVALGGLGDDGGQRRLADAGRAPEDDGAELVVFNGAAERFARAEDMLLADVVIEGVGAEAFGKRTPGRVRCRVAEQAHGRFRWRRAS